MLGSGFGFSDSLGGCHVLSLAYCLGIEAGPRNSAEDREDLPMDLLRCELNDMVLQHRP